MTRSDSNHRTKGFSIDGMNCDHGRRALESALRKIPRLIVREVDVDSARVEYDPICVNRAQIATVIAAAGYKVRI